MLFDKDHSRCNKKQRIIVSAERGRKHIAHNDNSSDVFQYRIDGDIVQGTDIKKCDYIVENETKRIAYLIELKGEHLGEAVDQIESTLVLFSDKLKGYTVYLRIVYRSNTHAVNSAKVLRFKKKYGKMQRIETNIIEETI